MPLQQRPSDGGSPPSPRAQGSLRIGVVPSGAGGRGARGPGERNTLAIELAKNYDARKDRDREKLDNMIAYAQSALCRWRLMLRQFGETIGGKACRDCDNCRKAGSREPLAAAS